MIKNCLIFEKNLKHRNILSDILQSEQVACQYIDDITNIRSILEQKKFNLAIINNEIYVDKINKLISLLKSIQTNIIVIVTTYDKVSETKAKLLPCDLILSKPFELHEIITLASS